MSFGYSVSDALLLSQLAWNAIKNSRKACDEHDGLTREVSALHVVLRRLEQELKKPESPINVGASGDTCKQELQVIMVDCRKVLRVLGKILDKYNALSEEEWSGRKLWQSIKFGNRKMADLGDLRSKVVLYTSSITFYLNMVSMGTVGRIEQEMNKSGGVLKEIQLAINSITTHFISRNKHEGSVFTDYADDDKRVWREFRRELRQDGFTSSVLRRHKHLILEYIMELGNRGLLDDQDSHEIEEDWPDLDPGSNKGMNSGPSDSPPSKPPEVKLPTDPMKRRKDSQPEALRLGPRGDPGSSVTPITGPTEVEFGDPSSRQTRQDDQIDLKRENLTSAEAIVNLHDLSSESLGIHNLDVKDDREKEKRQETGAKEVAATKEEDQGAFHGGQPQSWADGAAGDCGSVRTVNTDPITQPVDDFKGSNCRKAKYVVDSDGEISFADRAADSMRQQREEQTRRSSDMYKRSPEIVDPPSCRKRRSREEPKKSSMYEPPSYDDELAKKIATLQVHQQKVGGPERTRGRSRSPQRRYPTNGRVRAVR